jgi:hypothetical protein
MLPSLGVQRGRDGVVLLIEKRCEVCGKASMLDDAPPANGGPNFERIYVCPDGHKTVVRGKAGEPSEQSSQLDSIRKLNSLLDGLEEKRAHDPDVCGDCWFLTRVIRKLVDQYKHLILMGRQIEKEQLYRSLSWWFRIGKDDARHVLRMMARSFEGVEFTNQGLFIPKSYLPKGGESGEAVE